MVKRKAGGSAARVDHQFAIHRLDMAIHCIGTQGQLLGELLITQPLTEEAQHLDFPWGQPARKVQFGSTFWTCLGNWTNLLKGWGGSDDSDHL